MVDAGNGNAMPPDRIVEVSLLTREAYVLNEHSQPVSVGLKLDPEELVRSIGGSAEFAMIQYQTGGRVWLRRSQIGDVVEIPSGLQRGWGGPGATVLMKYDPVIAEPDGGARIDPLKAGAWVLGLSVEEVRRMIESDWECGGPPTFADASNGRPPEGSAPTCSKTEPPTGLQLRACLEASRLKAAAAGIVALARPQWSAIEAPDGASYLLDPAGAPDMPPLVAAIDLSDVDVSLGLPTHGSLLFAYDSASQPWGDELTDAASFFVTLSETSAREAVSVAMQRSVAVRFLPGIGLPAIDSLPAESLPLSTDEDEEAYLDLLAELYGEPGAPDGVSGTWLGGYPYQLQDDMQEQCAEMAEAAWGLESEPSEWRLLLQLASEPAANMSWGDDGFLYYWIRESDLAARDFSHVWCILQTT